MELEEYRKSVDSILLSISTKIQNILKTFSEKNKITVLQFQILRAIYLKKDITIGNLCKNLHLDTGNVSAMCKKLEKENLINRKRTLEDERVVVLTLTENGYDIVKNIESALNEKYKTILETKSEKELVEIQNILEKLNNIFSDISFLVANKDNSKGGIIDGRIYKKV